jgi:hypothetical protein
MLKHSNSNSNSISQARSETPQFNDISDEKIFYDAEITPIINSAESIRSSKSLLILIIFPDLSVKTKDKNLDLILQI